MGKGFIVELAKRKLEKEILDNFPLTTVVTYLLLEVPPMRQIHAILFKNGIIPKLYFVCLALTLCQLKHLC